MAHRTICALCGKVYTVDLRTNNGSLCTPCFDRAGDDNSVSDGGMTCAEFQARYGAHSEYCDCTLTPAVDVSLFALEVRHGADAWTTTGDVGDLPTIVATAKRFRSVGWDVQIVQRTVVFSAADLDAEVSTPQHRRAATPTERWALRIPETCVADKHGDCITHYHVVQP